MADPTKALTPEQQLENLHAPIEQLLMAHLAEHTALACLMRRPDWIDQAADELPVEWFQSRPGRAIYAPMLGESARVRQEGRAPNLSRAGLWQFAERAGIAHEFAKVTQPRSQDMLACVENLRIEPSPTTMRQAMASMHEARRRLEAYRALKRAQVAVTTTQDKPVPSWPTRS